MSMRKTVIILFFMVLAFSAIASAQITIAGQDFSMLVVIPLILMAVFMLIFGIVIAFDKHREKKEKEMLKIEVEKENHRYGMAGGVKERAEEEKKTEEKEEKEKEKKEKIVKRNKQLADYFDEISNLKKRFKKLKPDDAFKQLVALIRNFFSDYLGMEYEFTFEELENELRAKNKEVVFFSKNLSDMSYDAEGISKKNIAKLLGEFENVVEKVILKEEITTERHEEKKEAFAKRTEAKESYPKEEKEKEEAKKAEYIEEERKNRIIELIREGRAY